MLNGKVRFGGNYLVRTASIGAAEEVAHQLKQRLKNVGTHVDAFVLAEGYEKHGHGFGDPTSVVRCMTGPELVAQDRELDQVVWRDHKGAREKTAEIRRQYLQAAQVIDLTANPHGLDLIV